MIDISLSISVAKILGHFLKWTEAVGHWIYLNKFCSSSQCGQ